MILFFSGTGNSEYVARKIADQTGFRLHSINDSLHKEEQAFIVSEDPLVFVTPTYAWRIPKVVEEWILSTEFSGNRKAYFVMTCGDDNGNAEKYLELLCLKKDFKYIGCVSVIMPENYLAMYPVPEEGEAIQIIRRSDSLITKIAEDIRSHRVFEKKKIVLSDRLKSGIVNTCFYRFFVHAKKFTASDSCIGCGVCVDQCPLNNIRLQDEKPIWSDRCTHCMACICHCPTQAIEYGKISKGKRRYTCPL